MDGRPFEWIWTNRSPASVFARFASASSPPTLRVLGNDDDGDFPGTADVINHWLAALVKPHSGPQREQRDPKSAITISNGVVGPRAELFRISPSFSA